MVNEGGAETTPTASPELQSFEDISLPENHVELSNRVSQSPSDQAEDTEMIDVANYNQNEPEDADMLLALQLSLADYDEDGFSAFALGHHLPRANNARDESSTEAALHDDSPPSYEEDFELALAISESLRPDTTVPWRTVRPRDRYDIAGIPTYRVDPRRHHGFYSRCQGARQESTWHPFGTHTPRPAHLEAEGEPSVQSLKVKAACTPSCPILDPLSGAPLLNILNADALLYLVNNFLYFPDAFALALTCKSIHAVLNLKFLKRKYHDVLSSTYRHKLDAAGRRDLCDICLYVLPSSYFPPGQTRRDSATAMINTSKTCTDCVEFRARIKLEEEGTEGKASSGSKSMVAPVWRPSERIFLDRAGGRLWYRQRE